MFGFVRSIDSSRYPVDVHRSPIQALPLRRFLHVRAPDHRGRLHRKLPADRDDAVVRRVRQDLVVGEDVGMALRRRRHPSQDGPSRLPGRTYAQVPGTGRAQL